MPNHSPHYIRVREWRKNTRRKAIEAMGGKCVCCGYSKTVTNLAFHHLDADNKVFTIQSGRTRSWEAIVAELRKCVLVCVRCHVEIHEGLTTVPSDAARFNEAYTSLWRNNESICPVCGNPKPFGNIVCSVTCSGKTTGMSARGEAENGQRVAIKHGSVVAYSYHKCRCAICKAHNTARAKAYRLSRSSAARTQS